MKKCTLITGSSGFLGQNLISFLEQRSVSLILPDRKELGSLSLSYLNDVDNLVHLAGKAHDVKRTLNPNEYYKVNFELTKNIYDIFLKSDAKKFIFISSVKAVADSVDGILMEDMEALPKTDYGKSKLMAEEYIRNHSLPDGKSYYILRPCMIHGPGNKGNLNLLYKFVEMGIPYPLAAFRNKRSFLSVKNLCFVIKNILEKEMPSGVYNIADDEALSTNEVVSILAQSINRKPKLWAVSLKWIRFAAKIGDKIKLPLNTERLNKLTENYVVSNAKVKAALGISLPLSAQEGLKITASSFGRPKL